MWSVFVARAQPMKKRDYFLLLLVLLLHKFLGPWKMYYEDSMRRCGEFVVKAHFGYKVEACDMIYSLSFCKAICMSLLVSFIIQASLGIWISDRGGVVYLWDLFI